jgi:hypothetical protein
MGVKSTWAVMGIAAVLASAGAAAAQDDAALLRDGLFARDRNISVTERPKPEYQAPPLRAGAFVFDPTVAAGLEYNDNIYATHNLKTSDAIVHVQPSLTVQSDWSRNQISGFARINVNEYLDRASESTTDYAVGGAERLDAQRDLGFLAGASFERDTEPRTSEAETFLTKNPIRYDLADAYAEGAKQFDRLRLTAKVEVADYSYDNGMTAGGLPLYEQDRDHTQTTEAFKAEYAYRPQVSFLASLITNQADYRSQRPDEISRSSSGYDVTVGSNFDFTHLLRGEVFLGYLDQDYDNSSVYKNVRGFAARGKIEYFPTQLLTLTLSGSRSVQDSGLFDVGGFLSNVGGFQADYELLRNVILSVLASYTQDDYQNYDRTDRIDSEQISLIYLMNRAVSVNLSYAAINQNSSGAQAGPKYDINRLIGSLAYRF